MEEILSRIPYELFSYIGGGIFLFIILYRFFPNLFLRRYIFKGDKGIDFKGLKVLS